MEMHNELPGSISNGERMICWHTHALDSIWYLRKGFLLLNDLLHGRQRLFIDLVLGNLCYKADKFIS